MILTEAYKRRIQHLAGIRESVEIEDIDARTKLAVFDFDGTLVDTPIPEDANKAIWKKKTGLDWEGGWFSNPNSLRIDVFDMPVKPEVISDYKREWSDPKSLVIMLTGRIPSVANNVKAVLDDKGLKFDDYLFNEGGATEDSKIKHMEDILRYNPSIRDVELWDDRDPHIPIFKEWGDEMIAKRYLDSFKVNHIPGFRH